MKLTELRQLKAGYPVWISEGRGWRREATFIKLVEITTFGKVTIDDLIRNRVDFNNGKKKTKVVVEFVDDYDRTRREYIDTKKIPERK